MDSNVATQKVASQKEPRTDRGGAGRAPFSDLEAPYNRKAGEEPHPGPPRTRENGEGRRPIDTRVGYALFQQKGEAALKPLEGLKVVELARILAGPWAGQILADLGADVVKVERPGGGDDTRVWGPPFLEGENGEQLDSAYFHSCNRGKRSLAVDFENVEGREIIRKLAAGADVLIENFKTGGLAKVWPRLREPEGGQPEAGLLLDHRLRT